MAHLKLLLAGDAPAAMLIKYGPGRCSCTVGWDRGTDTFKTGQCLRQRLESPDLSPDGKYFSYYVDTHNSALEHSVYRVVSRAPWLKAEAFWSADSWVHGPGRSWFLRGSYKRPKIYAGNSSGPPKWDHLGVEVVTETPAEWAGFAIDGVHFPNWQRDGWGVVTAWGVCPPGLSAGVAQWKSVGKVHRVVFSKSLARGWQLQMTHWMGINKDVDRGIIFETFAMVSPGGVVTPQPDWVSADYDAPRKRVVWTRNNILYAAAVRSRGLAAEQLLWDGRGLKFSAIKAPY